MSSEQQTSEQTARIRAVVEDPTLTFQQRLRALAKEAEDTLDHPPLSEACEEALAKRVICDMYEGNAPYRPRYTLPDYELAQAQGSSFLELEPPAQLDEALAFQLCLYANVPSITGYPVWLGDVDRLIEPFASQVDDEELRRRLRLHWVTLDRLFPDAFTHANLGPSDSRVARTVLGLHRELRQVVPNLTLKVDPTLTPESLLVEAAGTIMAVSQPHLVNHPMMVADLGERYGVVSCYNSLPVGGGAHTLVRLNLYEVALRHAGDPARFAAETLEPYVELAAELMESRIRYLVEQARFFEHSWLVQEGLLSLERFSAMFGVVGLAECVETLLHGDGREARYGHDEDAGDLARAVVSALAEQVEAREMPYCEVSGGHALLHSQAGLESDQGFTVGTRVPAGREPELYKHLRAVAPNHPYFPSGISDIVRLEAAAAANPGSVVDIARGAMEIGMRDVTFEPEGGEFIRITGYLARRSDIAEVDAGVRHASTVLGAGSVANMALESRRVQRVRSNELEPRPAG